MIVSKVRISKETRARLDAVPTESAKKKLREELVKDHIRNAVSGICSKQELIVAAGFDPNAKSKSYAKGVGLLTSMIKRGIISHENTVKYRKIWTVNEDVKTRPIVKPTPEQVAESVVPKDVVVALREYKELDRIALVDMAKEFAWQNNSDSLREFIAYVQNAIK